MRAEYSLNYREAMQTPPKDSLHEDRKFNTQLAPPCHLVEREVVKVMDVLGKSRDFYMELPTPISSPSAAHLVRRLLSHAVSRGISERVPVHTRMKKEDASLAIEAGAKALHLYGNSSENGGSSQKSVSQLKGDLFEIAQLAKEKKVTHLRASLEHATDTPITEISEFIDAISEINMKLGSKVINAIGLPDTNGTVGFGWYEDVFKVVGDKIRDEKLQFFVHIHDDSLKAKEQAKRIVKLAKEKKISVVVETVPDMYPGERNGIRPRFSDVSDVIQGKKVPKSAKKAVDGSSWLRKIPNNIDHAVQLFQEAMHTHVAGVHTAKMGSYGDKNNGIMENVPAAGTYGIMGKNNIAWVQEHVLGIEKSSDEVLTATALIGRELASQFGNQPHGYTIGLSNLATQFPQDMVTIAQTFGNTTEWLGRDIPDLHILHRHIQKDLSNYFRNKSLYQYGTN